MCTRCEPALRLCYACVLSPVASYPCTMAPRGGPKVVPPLPPELMAFRKLVASCNKFLANDLQQKFVKRLEIPTVALLIEYPRRSALNLSKRGLIG
jgi:hypothetical protein